MAFQSEAAPPVVGEAYKDTYDGETKSDDEEDDDETEEDYDEKDLEDGEILDSGNEMEPEIKTEQRSPIKINKISPSKKDGPSPLKKMQEIFKLAEKKGPDKEKKDVKKEKSEDHSHSKYQRRNRYFDHDQVSEEENENKEGNDASWYERTNRKKPGGTEGPLDYRKELEMYAGTPPSSPERDDNGEIKKKRKRSQSGKSKAKIQAKRAKRRAQERKAGKPQRSFITKKPCKYFLDGDCKKGADCPFSHVRPRERNRELCRYYLNGYCQKGKQCTFMHGDFPCKFYHTDSECYSGDKCRYSHKPLTEETRKLLQEVLKGYRNPNHEGQRKRNRSRTPERRESPAPAPPPAKRVCLLGSPPRHIREAEETRLWQEEMAFLHQEKNFEAFQIHPPFRPVTPAGPPDQFARPNFYVDTMQSPPKPERNLNFNDRIMGPFDQANHFENQARHDEDMRPNFHWPNICALVESMKESPNANMNNNNNEEEEFNFDDDDTDIDNFEGTYEPLCIVKSEELEDTNVSSQSAMSDIDERVPSKEEPMSPSNSPKQEQLVEPDPSAEVDPIHIPSHLPRTQRELLLRIQRHQKTKSAEDDENTEDGGSVKAESESVTTTTAAAVDEQPTAIKQENEDFEEKKTWYSSDEDDDDDGDSLTNILNKLRQMPLPKPEIPEKKPAPNISDMVSNILQKAKGNNNNDTTLQEQGKFWNDIFTGSSMTEKPQVKAAATSTTTSMVLTPPVSNSVTSNSGMPPKRRVLLPNPKPVEKASVPESRDPRLKNRDPRANNSMPTSSPALLPPPKHIPFVPLNAHPNNQVPPPLTILPLETRTFHSLNQHPESMVLSQTSAVIVDGLSSPNIPYRLHTVSCMPLNYMRYVQVSHSDPKLVNDPRLRKYLSSEKLGMPHKLATISDGTAKSSSMLPDLPLFKMEKTENFIVPRPERISPSHSSDMPQLPELKLPHVGTVFVDPRTKRNEQRRLSGGRTPPHSDTPPAVAAPSAIVGSHLPRAIVDPRMAKLHKPIAADPRRSRVSPDATSKTNAIPNRLQIVSSTNSPETPGNKDEAEPNQTTAAPTNETEAKDSSVKKKFGESKKNKAVHRNRKTSMDYASPLNSCDNSSSSLNYNSYNKRPQQPRNCAMEVPKPTEVLPSASSLASSLLPDFTSSDSSSIECDDPIEYSDNASLKDMFKTIDPTASPFC